MGDDEERTRILAECRFQTLDRRQVQVVRRFVEEKYVGISSESGPDLPAFPLAGRTRRWKE